MEQQNKELLAETLMRLSEDRELDSDTLVPRPQKKRKVSNKQTENVENQSALLELQEDMAEADDKLILTAAAAAAQSTLVGKKRNKKSRRASSRQTDPEQNCVSYANDQAEKIIEEESLMAKLRKRVDAKGR